MVPLVKVKQNFLIDLRCVLLSISIYANGRRDKMYHNAIIELTYTQIERADGMAQH